MSIAELVLDKLRNLPAYKQQQVLDFVSTLTEQDASSKHRRNEIKGLCADLGVSISAEDIDEARREMWGPYMSATQ